MEYGGVRPAHPVEHHALELEQFRFLGISTKGESPVVPDCVVELVGLEPTTKVLWKDERRSEEIELDSIL